MNGPVLATVLLSLGAWALILILLYRRRFGVSPLPAILPYGLLLATVLATILSGRDYAVTALGLELQPDVDAAKPMGAALVGWALTGLVLAASFEAIVHGLRSKELWGPRVIFLIAFVAFWLTNVASPALLATHGSFEHDYTYSLLIGVGLIVLRSEETAILLASTRDSILLLVLASLGLAVVNPGLVLDLSYNRGWIPGLPRLAGLTPHPVMLGFLSSLGLLILWGLPYRRKSWTMAATLVLGTGFVISQAKLAWVALPLSALSLFALSGPDDPEGRRGLRLDRPGSLVAVGVATLSIVLLALSFWAPGLSPLEDVTLAERASTLSGRTEIWDIAYSEWARSPLFGYGSDLFKLDYRIALGSDHMTMTDSHNQILDSMARAGVVGLWGLVAYLGVLSWGALRTASISGGLSFALLTFVLLQSMTEVPLSIFGYGPGNLLHFSLLAAVSGPFSSLDARREASSRPEGGKRRPEVRVRRGAASI